MYTGAHLGPGLDLDGVSVGVPQHLLQQRHGLLRLLGGPQAGIYTYAWYATKPRPGR